MAVYILIVEDEDWAKDSLVEMLMDVSWLDFELTHHKTIRDAVAWLSTNKVDLIFMDIHLGDGLSFHIFDQVAVKSPVIFTTAFDSYALEAFRNQGYAYLLKPYDEAELEEALLRVKPLLPQKTPTVQAFKNRFLVKYGIHLKSIAADEIAYFMAEDKLLYATLHSGDEYIVEDTITSLSDRLDPKRFFQVNRKFIVSIAAIIDMVKLSRSRIRLSLHPPVVSGAEVIVSEDKSNDFQRWLGE
ncbi:response regulator transcription factor [Sphingobacterium psychroaquaticum]|uniref:LytR/AlgR family response regulator transcription factor n=1 Tax=Sphingobacterium psychroaquaticum TaxID=561061 RepID=UPI00106C1803|nr:LytTR family DNA-binding domain-containing protein [Sphingobacterium psychroaquaticum]QBQ42637.1 response regulator transcription factor [Sphingobacterium psychroaquaticum]